MAPKKLSSVQFEVFGTVQGVCFRMYTQRKAKELNLKGWCMNTSAGTVKGAIEGEQGAVDQMKHWLSTTGSPSSHITKANFDDEKEIPAYTFTGFSIRG